MNDGHIITIGDIHGCSVALATLVEAIQPTPLDTRVFLSDYIDRGLGYIGKSRRGSLAWLENLGKMPEAAFTTCSRLSGSNRGGVS
jgi:hypothetical protein